MGAQSDYLEGKTTSIKTGLSAIDPAVVDEILLLNVDQPRSSADIAHILNTHRSGDSSVTIPTCGGKGGHPIVFSAKLLDELLAIDEESQGVKAVVQRRPESVNRFPLENPEILLDLNTPEQYRAAVETFAAGKGRSSLPEERVRERAYPVRPILAHDRRRRLFLGLCDTPHSFSG